MTRVYFVRHAEPVHSHADDATRPLSAEGLRDSEAVTRQLADKNINFIISSPYKRSVDTIAGLAKSVGLEIHTDIDLRERERSEADFDQYPKYWENFDFHTEGGECLRSVQERNIRALQKVLSEHKDENIVIGTHGTALSTILNYYYPRYDHGCFMKIVDFMPFVIRLDFEEKELRGYQTELVIHKEFRKENK